MIRRVQLLALAMLGASSPAWAHAFLEHAEPPVGSEVAVPPHQLILTFTEGVEPLFTTVQVQDAQGGTIATGKPHTAPDSNRRLEVDLPPLSSGVYTVIWHATSVDTHKTEGSYKFTVHQ
jgi:methionine-rich copper-binding protein CopC